MASRPSTPAAEAAASARTQRVAVLELGAWLESLGAGEFEQAFKAQGAETVRRCACD